MDESEIKTSRFGDISEDFESGIESGNLESGELRRVNDFLSNPNIFPPANF